MRFIWLLTLALSLNANANNSEQCSYDHKEMDLANNFSLKNSFIASTELSSELCLILLGEKSDIRRLETLSENWKRYTLEELKDLENSGIDIKQDIEALAASFAAGCPGGIVVNRVPTNSWRIDIPSVVNGGPATSGGRCGETVNSWSRRLSEDTEEKCQSRGKSCMDILDDLRMTVHAVNADGNRLRMERALTNIGLYSKAWDQYFEDARSLTPWELLLNTAIYRNELRKDTFVLPPKYQWFLLHPSIVIENVSDALDGNQQKDALSIEWVGINRWNGKIPLGLSIVSTYADRQNIDDIRHGLMLHVYNDYSVGFTGIGSQEEGIFITMDLLKMAQSKQKRLQNYKAKVESYQRALTED